MNDYDQQSHQSQLLTKLNQEFPHYSIETLKNLIFKHNGDYYQIKNYIQRTNYSSQQRPMTPHNRVSTSRPSYPHLQVNNPMGSSSSLRTSHSPLHVDLRPEVLPTGDQMYNYLMNGERPSPNYSRSPHRSVSQQIHVDKQRKAKNELSHEVDRLRKVELNHQRKLKTYKEMLERIKVNPSFPTVDDIEYLKEQIKACQPTPNPIHHSESTPTTRVSTPDRSQVEWRPGQESPRVAPNTVSMFNIGPNIDNFNPNHPAYQPRMTRIDSAPSNFTRIRSSHSPALSSSPAPENAQWKSIHRDDEDRTNSNIQWECPKCTFLNNGMLHFCEICNASRPRQSCS